MYGVSCARKLAVEKAVFQRQQLYGYRSVQTPTFEFAEIFSRERGSVSSREMFKFFDRDGNTLVLRPDMTPSIARIAAKYFLEEEFPLRFCYCGSTFINNSGYQGRLKETTQMGAELIGDDSPDADAEMAAMLIDCLLASGLTEFQVEVGHIDFFNGLMEEAGLRQEEVEALRELIENKNYFGVEELLDKKPLPASLKEVIRKIPELFGSLKLIQEAKALTSNEKSLRAIYRLEKLYRILEGYGLERFVSFDLGMLGKYQYYTGIIFKAMTYGTGEPIATGGRYDRLMEQFGKEAASVGWGIVSDALLMALDRQKIPVPSGDSCRMLFYERERKEEAVRLAAALRALGIPVQAQRMAAGRETKDYIGLARRSGAPEAVLFLKERTDLYRVFLPEEKKETLEAADYLREQKEGGK